MGDLFKKYPFIARVVAIDTILVLFLLDQVSKWWLLEHVIRPLIPQSPDLSYFPHASFLDWITALNLTRFPFVVQPVTSFFNIVMVWNQGISFGFFGDTAGTGNMILMLALLAVVIGFGIWMFRTTDHMIRFTLALVIGGALGNLWDRVRFGAVADFFDFHIGEWHYPAFNVADSSIVLGIILLIGYELLIRPRTRKDPKAATFKEVS